MANDDEWKRAEWGKAKAAFDKSRTVQPKPTEKPLLQPGRHSEMVKKDRPAFDGPKPKGFAREVVVRQTNKRDLAKEAEGALKAQPPVSGKSQENLVELEHRKEGTRLRQKFLEAARHDKDKGR